MKTHELKTWPEFFQDVADQRKTFEYRKDDRGFEVGDALYLKEYDRYTDSYSGAEITAEVLEVYKFLPGLPDDYCIMQIKVLRVKP